MEGPVVLHPRAGCIAAAAAGTPVAPEGHEGGSATARATAARHGYVGGAAVDAYGNDRCSYAGM
eukprot:11186252-Lingulodinium_polyedra.AAC.1